MSRLKCITPNALCGFYAEDDTARSFLRSRGQTLAHGLQGALGMTCQNRQGDSCFSK